MAATRPLRVHHVVDSLASGGAELLLAELALVAPQAGMEMSVGYLEDRGGSPAAVRLREVGVQPTLIAIPPRMYTSALLRVRRHLAEVRPDVVHTHLGASDVLAGLAARSLGIPSVSTVHSLGTGADAPPTARGRARNRVYALGAKASAARLVAVSESARQEVLRRDGYAPERVVVIHNGIARRPAPGAGPYVREQLGIGPEDPVVGTLSTLRPVKGHEVAIGAMAEIARRVPGAKLVVVGEGESRPALERAAAGLGPAVKFAGFRDDVMPVLDAFDVLAHPSRQEAFPTTLLEAMAAGVPQVATAIGGIPEIVEDGRTGVLLRPPPQPAELAERVVGLLENPELRGHLADAGRERFAEHFGAEGWARRLRALYDEVLEERR